MSNLITISGVRGFIDENGVAQLNTEDISKGLGFTQMKNGVKYVRWERVNGYLENMGFPQLVGKEFIPENVFYRLGMKGENESAQQFQIKVADEILPAIRKHGMYMTEEVAHEAIENVDLFLSRALLIAKEKMDKLEFELKQNEPKVLFADSVTASESLINVGDLAKILKQNGIDIGRTRLHKWLRENGYLMKQGSSWNMPTQKAAEMKLFKVYLRTVNTADRNRIIRGTKVTGKGTVYFVNLFLKGVEAA